INLSMCFCVCLCVCLCLCVYVCVCVCVCKFVHALCRQMEQHQVFKSGFTTINFSKARRVSAMKALPPAVTHKLTCFSQRGLNSWKCADSSHCFTFIPFYGHT